MKKLLLLLIALAVGLAGQKASAYTVYFNLDDGVSNVFDNKEGSSWDNYWSYLQYGNPLIANADETVNLRIECKLSHWTTMSSSLAAHSILPLMEMPSIIVEMLTFSEANSQPSVLADILVSTHLMAISLSDGKTLMMKSPLAT